MARHWLAYWQSNEIEEGRGRGSKGAPIIKRLVRRLIKDLPQGMVRDWALTHDEGGYRIRLY